MKRVFAMLLSLCLLVSLAACGGADQGAAADTTAATAQVFMAGFGKADRKSVV